MFKLDQLSWRSLKEVKKINKKFSLIIFLIVVFKKDAWQSTIYHSKWIAGANSGGSQDFGRKKKKNNFLINF